MPGSSATTAPGRRGARYGAVMTSPFYDLEELFDVEEYLYFMEETLASEDTASQVSFLERALGATAPMRFLDLGCGHGRHGNELARRGHRVLGIDLVEGFLERARADAEREGLRAAYVRADMAAFDAPERFDRALCLFDAFGFFDDAHQARTLECVHRALEPDGKLLLDVRTREWMVRLPPCSVLEKGEDMMIDRHRFDIASGRFVDKRTYLRGGRRRDVTFSVRLWAYTELRAFLAAAGFSVEAAYGGWDGVPLSAARDRTLVVCVKDG